MRKRAVEQKIANPSAYYRSPREVLRDRHLSAELKRCVLKSMEVDARGLNAAVAENMGGGERGPQLQEIREALRALENAGGAGTTDDARKD